MGGFDIIRDCDILLKPRVKGGLAATVATGLLSVFAVTGLLIRVALNAFRNSRKPAQYRQKTIRTHIDAYFLFLLLSDLLQGLGASINIRWLVAGRTFCGSTCTAQGAIKEIGETGVAMITLVITLHTFFTIFFHWIAPSGFRFPCFIIGCILAFITLFVGINGGMHPYRPGGPEPYYAPTPFYCWVSKGYSVERIVGEYIFLWMCAVLSIVFYVPLYFCLRGNIRIDSNNWTRISFHSRRSSSDPLSHVYSSGSSYQQEAVKMLGYPIAYVIIVLPMSVGRWLAYAHVEQNVTDNTVVNQYSMLIVIGSSIFGLSGVVNVALFLFTRPKLLSLNQDRPHRRHTSQLPAVVRIRRSVSQVTYPDTDTSMEFRVTRGSFHSGMETPLGEEVYRGVQEGEYPTKPEWSKFKSDSGLELSVEDHSLGG